MARTYVKLASTTLNGTVSSVTFSSISSSYTDLILAINSKISSTQNINLRFNSDTNSNYSQTFYYGDGTNKTTSRQTNQTSNYSGTSYTEWSPCIIQIMNYSNPNIYKTFLSRYGEAGNVTVAITSLWRSTNAITQIDILSASSGNWTTGSTFTLYGIKAEV